MLVVGVDTGGTFTDFVCHDGRSVRVHKQLSTPDAPERSIIDGLTALGIVDHAERVVHGSTVATNALLEGRGARTVFITNRGFGDILTIGRQARRELYNLTPQPATPPVSAQYCLETGGRLGADGSVVDALNADDLAALGAAVSALEPQAVAVCLLFSFLDPRFEQQVRDALPDSLEVSCSHEVLPEHREYERGIATWLNASLGPAMRGYLERLHARMAGSRLSIMQSSAVTCAPDYAASHAVNLLLSGPAGGLLGARHVAAATGARRIMTFDMGGTSTDVALIDGDIALTTEGQVGDYPVSVPMVDMHTIGAGGGSIAYVDDGGLLRVGPRSAGAAPGPACYGAGGTAVTVTDANLVLGRLPDGLPLGDSVRLDRAAAHAALARLAEDLAPIEVEALAAGIVDIANDHMQQALRVISIERGFDPREFTLVSFGGAGGLHVCALAEALNMRRALVPADAGVLSALGMIVAPPGRRLSRTLRRELGGLDADELERCFEAIAAPGFTSLADEGHAPADLVVRRSVDVCYAGQSFAINLPWRDAASVAEAFHGEHERRYGHRLDHPIELVTARVALDAPAVIADTRTRAVATGAPAFNAVSERFDILRREALPERDARAGPLVVIDDVATLYVAPGWSARRDDCQNVVLEFR